MSTFQRALSLGNATAPADLISAQFSVPFAVALALIEGERALQPMSEHSLSRSDVTAAAERVKLRLDDELNSCFPVQIPARVSISAGGQHFEKEIRVPLGDPANPLTDAQLVQKAIKLCSGLRAEQEVCALADQIIFSGGAEASANLDPLTALTSFVADGRTNRSAQRESRPELRVGSPLASTVEALELEAIRAARQ